MRAALSLRPRVARSTLAALAWSALAGVAAAQQPAAPRDPDLDVNTDLPSAANVGQQSIGELLPEPFKSWNGLRPWLVDRGLTFAFTHQGDTMGDVTGGGRTGMTFMGRAQGVVEFDPQKTTGWTGGLAHISAYQIHGVGLSGHFVNSIEPVSDLEAVATTRLYEAWFEQKLTDQFSIRAGQLGVDTEFFLSPYYGLAVGGTFGWPSIVTIDLPSGGPAYPFSAPGIRVKYSPNDQLAFLAAIFNGDPAGPGTNNPQYRNVYGVSFRVKDPPFIIGEAQIKYGTADNSPIPPGTFRIGGWTHLGKFADQRIAADGRLLSDPGSVGTPLQRRGDFGVYGVIDQQIYQRPTKKDDGVYVFSRMSFSPSDRNFVSFYVDGGLSVQGLVPGRPDDQFGFLASYTKVSPAKRAADFDSNFFNASFAPAHNYETIVEAVYLARVASGIVLQPNIQYVIHPGGGIPDPRDRLGVRNMPNALVLGVRTTIQY